MNVGDLRHLVNRQGPIDFYTRPVFGFFVGIFKGRRRSVDIVPVKGRNRVGNAKALAARGQEGSWCDPDTEPISTVAYVEKVEGERVRIISARKAIRSEMDQYKMR